jgi:hypothetical protein
VTTPATQHEHEFEAEHGLPEPLPANETMLWQGAPDWHVLARQVFHVRKLMVYFALMLAWRGTSLMYDGATALQAAGAVAILLPLVLLALGLMYLMAWLTSRTTAYSITDRRVVMRVGIVLSITFNLPFKRIESAALRQNSDASGDLVLHLAGEDRIAYLHLWPHVRPWRINKTEPMLRALPRVNEVARILAIALAKDSGQAAPRSMPVPEQAAGNHSPQDLATA